MKWMMLTLWQFLSIRLGSCFEIFSFEFIYYINVFSFNLANANFSFMFFFSVSVFILFLNSWYYWRESKITQKSSKNIENMRITKTNINQNISRLYTLFCIITKDCFSHRTTGIMKYFSNFDGPEIIWITNVTPNPKQ